MPFFKRTDEELFQAPNFVHMPGGISLTVDNHAEYEYPVDGWYWFDTLDEAMAALITPPPVPTVTALQGMLAINAAGLTEAFVTWKATLDPIADFAAIAFFEKAQTWKRDNEYLLLGAQALGLDDVAIHNLFVLAATL